MNRMKERVIVKQEAEDGRFTFSFVYSANPATTPGRQFNMNRHLTEAGDQFVSRIESNVNKVLNKKKKKGAEEVLVSVKFTSETGKEIVTENVSAGDLIRTKGLQMSINNTEYQVVYNPPLLEAAKINEPIMTGCFANPNKVEQKFSTDTKYEWFTSNQVITPEDAKKQKLDKLIAQNWKLRSQDFFFHPEISDIGCSVRLDITPYQHDIKGDTLTVISESQVEAGPDLTATLARQAWTQHFTQFPILRVMTYNILADLYADSEFSRTELFPQCPTFAMDYRYRVKLILQELINFHPDIICLQETDRKVFNHELLPILDKFGYNGEYLNKGGQVSEGLSIFWRKNKFELLESRSCIFNTALSDPSFNHLISKVKKVPGLLAKLEARTTAVQLTALQSSDDENEMLIVGNTHLFFKPDADHIRLIQTDMCLTQIKLFRQELAAKFPQKRISVMLCGDFNSTPPFGVLQYCREGSIRSDHPDWRSCPGEEISGLELSHPFNLDSAAGTPQYTNYTVGFKDCLDYIFYDKSTFSVEQVVPFPTNEELELNTALPNVSFPSDHISVVVDLKWQQK